MDEKVDDQLVEPQFEGRLPDPVRKGGQPRTSRVGRQELSVRLQALADDTRLAILQLFAGNAELTAQDVIAQLGLSQPVASRQLNQLRGAGYLREWRRRPAKAYRLDLQQVADTFQALETFLQSQPEPPSEPFMPDAPVELRRFLDEEGRAIALPVRQHERSLVLDYLAQKFEPGHDYSERDVNTLLSQWHTFHDPVTLRRELYDHRLINRERNGARYWRDAGATLIPPRHAVESWAVDDPDEEA